MSKLVARFASRAATLPHWRLILILLIAVILRLGYIPLVGHNDVYLFGAWGNLAEKAGLFNIYRMDSNIDYPPLYLAMLGVVSMLQTLSGMVFGVSSASSIGWVKLFPVLGDLVLIAVVYVWQRRDHKLRWLIPGCLAISPVLIVLSAFWGQTDGLMTLLIALVLIALNRDRPIAAWAFFAIALLLKFQSIVALPLLAILTLRRYGLLSAIRGAVVAGVIMLVMLIPFVIGSGADKALKGYLTVDSFPATTMNAFNLWYVLTPPTGGATLIWDGHSVPDQQLLLPSLHVSYKQVGFALLGGYTLLICLSMWLQAHKKYEFMWAAALYLGFFMLPTQIHERYLYAAVILAMIGTAQNRRLGPLALGLSITFLANVLHVTHSFKWLAPPLMLLTVPSATLVALLNVSLWIEFTPLALGWRFAANTVTEARMNFRRWGSRLARSLLVVNRLAIAGVVIVIVGSSCVKYVLYRPVARWLSEHVADSAQIVGEPDVEVSCELSYLSERAYTWDFRLTSAVETKSVNQWYADGAYYLLIDERTSSAEDFSQRIQNLVSQGAAVLYQYESNPIFGLKASQAVLRTFTPRYSLDVTFDNSLHLIGYDVTKTDAQDADLLLAWYTLETPGIPYQIFVHVINPDTGALLGQADTTLGNGVHPTNQWQNGEFYFQHISLSAAVISKLEKPYQIRIGLYDLSTGSRAQITDGTRKAIGDYVLVPLPD